MFRDVMPELRGRYAITALGVILLIGAALRFYGLGIQSLWFDEACSWYTSSHETLRDVLYHDADWHLHPPGYHLLLHFWMSVAGDSEVALRIPSAIGGLASIVVVAMLGARFFGRDTGIVAAGLSAVLLFPVYYSQETRPYGTLLFLSAAAMLSWTYLVNDWRNDRKAGAVLVTAYIVTALLTMYWHYFGLMFVALQGVGAIALTIGRWRKFAVAAAVYTVLAVAWLPWLPVMWAQLQNDAIGHAVPTANVFRALFETAHSFFNHGEVASMTTAAITWLAIGCMFAATLRGVVALRRAADTNERREILVVGLIISAWLLLPFAIAYLKSLTGPSVFTHRNLIVSLPIVYVLVARGLSLIPGPMKFRAIGGAVLLIALTIRLLASGYYTTPHKDQYREAVALVVMNDAQAPGSLIMAYGDHPCPYNYYFKRLGSDRHVELWAGRESDIPKVEAALAESSRPGIWYMIAEPKPSPAFLKWVDENLKVEGMRQFLRVDTLFLRQRGGP